MPFDFNTDTFGSTDLLLQGINEGLQQQASALGSASLAGSSSMFQAGEAGWWFLPNTSTMPPPSNATSGLWDQAPRFEDISEQPTSAPSTQMGLPHGFPTSSQTSNILPSATITGASQRTSPRSAHLSSSHTDSISPTSNPAQVSPDASSTKTDTQRDVPGAMASVSSSQAPYATAARPAEFPASLFSDTILPPTAGNALDVDALAELLKWDIAAQPTPTSAYPAPHLSFH